MRRVCRYPPTAAVTARMGLRGVCMEVVGDGVSVAHFDALVCNVPGAAVDAVCELAAKRCRRLAVIRSPYLAPYVGSDPLTPDVGSFTGAGLYECAMGGKNVAVLFFRTGARADCHRLLGAAIAEWVLGAAPARLVLVGCVSRSLAPAGAADVQGFAVKSPCDAPLMGDVDDCDSYFLPRRSLVRELLLRLGGTEAHGSGFFTFYTQESVCVDSDSSDLEEIYGANPGESIYTSGCVPQKVEKGEMMECLQKSVIPFVYIFALVGDVPRGVIDDLRTVVLSTI